VALAFVIPYLPFVDVIGFVALPGSLLAALCLIVAGYVGAMELVKRWFFGHPRQRVTA
jgi:hypothetical protein